MRRLFALATTFALAFPPRRRRGVFDPTIEFEQHEWIPIHLGPLNLSITKAVAYLMIGTLLTILLGIVLMRVKMPGRRQALGEMVYEAAQEQIAEQPAAQGDRALVPVRGDDLPLHLGREMASAAA